MFFFSLLNEVLNLHLGPITMIDFLVKSSTLEKKTKYEFRTLIFMKYYMKLHEGFER